MNFPAPLRRVQTALPWGVVALAGLFALRRLDNADTWWHLASGRFIVENRTVPTLDTLSYTVPDHAWVNLQWLHDVFQFLSFRIGSVDLLIVWAVLAYAGTFAILVVHLRRALGPVATTGIALWVLLACQDRFVIRPEMETFLFLQIALWLLATSRGDAGRRLWLFCGLMLVWANVHALFVLGIFAIACAVAAALLAENVPLPEGWRRGSALGRPARGRLWAVAGLSILAVTINPYFVRGALFPLELLSRLGPSSPFGSIGEFRSPFSVWFPDLTLGAFQSFFLFSCAVVAAAALVSARGRGDGRAHAPGFDLGQLFFFVGLAALSAAAYRNAALFALGVAPFVGQSLAVCRSALPATAPRWSVAATRIAAAVLALALLGGTWAVVSNRYYRLDGRTHEFGFGVLESSSPIRAAGILEEFDLPGPLYNDLTAGGYLTWARPNGERVFIDGRLEVYDEFYAEYSRGLRDPRAWARQATEFGFNSVLLFHGWANRHQLIGWIDRNPAWALVYFDEVAVVFVRAAGNDAVVDSARAAFQESYQANLDRLDEPPSTRGYPLGRVVSWENLGRLFGTLGDPSRAAECYEKARALEMEREP